MTSEYILKWACPDKVGLVATLAKLMENHNCFIASSRTYGDPETKRFFARLVFSPPSDHLSDVFQADLEKLGQDLNAEYELHQAGTPLKTLLLVSKSDYCANTLLYAARRKELPIDVCGIVSNHDTLKSNFAHWNLPWFHVPVTAKSKPEAERRLFEIIEDTGAELIVLARYMQVLSDEACHRLAGSCINIHHSFLPGFKGARPYHQAHARGVKIIGATSHYVTADLDEGPIIAQVVEPIDHTFTPDAMIETGRHLEGAALLRAVKAHAEHRVFIDNGKTIVFAR